MMPTYTNVNLHDEAVRGESLVLDFRLKHVERGKKEQNSSQHSLKSAEVEKLSELGTVSTQHEFVAFEKLLGRSGNKKAAELTKKQFRKLSNSHGASILMKRTKDSVVNVSGVNLDPQIKNIFYVRKDYSSEK